MAMKEQQRQVHRTMQGKEIDMAKLVRQNEMSVAVGNVKVNARGDELGPGGKIIRKVEDTIAPPSVNKDPKRKNVTNMDPEGKE